VKEKFQLKKAKKYGLQKQANRAIKCSRPIK
jgi:hypothetical protein